MYDATLKNATPHTAHVVLNFLDNHGIQVMPHPPYSPDLAPCDFSLFPELKKRLRGRRFTQNSAVVKAVEAIFKQLGNEFFSNTFAKWQTRWDSCIESEGKYFESL